MISKIKLMDGAEYSVSRVEVVDGHLEIDMNGSTAEEIQELFSNSEKLEKIELYTEGEALFGILERWMVYGGVILRGETKTVILSQAADDLEARIVQIEINSNEIKKAASISALSFTDEQALTVKGLYKKWEEDPEGYQYSMGNPYDLRRNHDGRLWRLNKDHKKQADWYPGADPTLWTEIVEGHAGTVEDPIPVPDSVTTSGFDYVYGKYYSEGGTVYLCQRQNVEDPEAMYGQIEKLYFAPSALVGQYFEQVV